MVDKESLLKHYEQLKIEGLTELDKVNDIGGTILWKNQYLSSGSPLAVEFKNLNNLSPEIKPFAGQELNQIKVTF